METMKHLELFSGTHSVGKVCKCMGIEVVSLDRDLPSYDRKQKPKTYESDRHFQEDILTWDYKQFENHEFTSISCSPVCLWSSQAKNSWINSYYNKDTQKFSREPKEGFILFTKEVKQEEMDRFMNPQVDRCFEIIEYFMGGNPNLKWWIENPRDSLMRHYISERYPQYDNNEVVDYCKFGFPYQKSTRFWNNFDFEGLRCKKNCDFMITKCGKRLHKVDLYCNTQIEIDGKLIRIDTKELRQKYKQEIKDYKNSRHLKNCENIGGGGTKETRYRLPPFLVSSMLNKIYL
tara:strand:+ start:488 stop:1357 length:870 start_codon:yes stop_codon:yes gene_type:complete